MACVIAATHGASRYTIINFFGYDASIATTSVILATLFAPITIYLGWQHRRRLEAVPKGRPGGEAVRSWYLTLAYFPSIAAAACWIAVLYIIIFCFPTILSR
jgi:hypothetical protein